MKLIGLVIPADLVKYFVAREKEKRLPSRDSNCQLAPLLIVK